MGQRTVLAALLMALGAGSTAFAGPILITSFERTGNNPFHNNTTRTGFVFELSGVLSETSIFLGTDPTALPAQRVSGPGRSGTRIQSGFCDARCMTAQRRCYRVSMPALGQGQPARSIATSTPIGVEFANWV